MFKKNRLYQYTVFYPKYFVRTRPCVRGSDLCARALASNPSRVCCCAVRNTPVRARYLSVLVSTPALVGAAQIMAHALQRDDGAVVSLRRLHLAPQAIDPRQATAVEAQAGVTVFASEVLRVPEIRSGRANVSTLSGRPPTQAG